MSPPRRFAGIATVFVVVALFATFSHAQQVVDLDGNTLVRDNAKYEKTQQDILTKGYMDLSDRQSKADSAREGMALEEQRGGERSFQNLDDVNYLSYQMRVGKLDSKFLLKGSVNHGLAGINYSARLYSKTVFGSLFIQEMFGGSLRGMPVTSLSIAGHSAAMTNAKYRDNKIYTNLVVASPEKLLMIEVDTQIDNSQQSEFLQMVESLLVEEAEVYTRQR